MRPRTSLRILPAFMVAGCLGFGSSLNATEAPALEQPSPLTLQDTLLHVRTQLVEHQQRTQETHRAFLKVQTLAGLTKTIGLLACARQKERLYKIEHKNLLRHLTLMATPGAFAFLATFALRRVLSSIVEKKFL